MSRSETIERERRWAGPAAIAAFGVLVLTLIGLFVSSGADLVTREDDSGFLRSYAEESGTLVPAALLQALGFALAAIPLYYLFRAAEARSDRVRGALVGVVVAGPLFIAVSIAIQAFAYDAIASDFVASGGEPCVGEEFDSEAAVDECVGDHIAEDGLVSVSGGLTLAGTLGLIFGMIYTSLHAMRVGLLTRFLGTLGMAVGAATVFFGPVFVVLYMAGLGLLFLGRVPGGKPPAWESGEAVPWPSPGERGRPPGPEPDEPVEGRADEIFPDAAAREEEPEPGSIAEELDRASRKADSESEGPQKRKRRS